MRWRTSKRTEEVVFGEVFDELSGLPSAKQIRAWDNAKLHAQITSGELFPHALSMAQAELRRREAWRAPAGYAFWISLCALLTSLIALAISAGLFRI